MQHLNIGRKDSFLSEQKKEKEKRKDCYKNKKQKQKQKQNKKDTWKGEKQQDGEELVQEHLLFPTNSQRYLLEGWPRHLPVYV